MTSPADVLRRLLVLQQTLVALHDEVQIGEFMRRTLLTVPGVSEVMSILGGRVIPPDDGFDAICGMCAQASDNPGSLDLTACETQTGAHCFPIWTASQLFGLLIVWVSDENLLQPYFDYIANIANAAAVELHARQFQTKLTEANEELRKARDGLERRVAERTSEVAWGNERLKRLSEELIFAQEDERQRIARELHDEIGQAFAAVRISLEITSRHVATEELRKRLHDGMQLVDHALELIHDLALDLRPPQLDDLGLAAALRWHVDRQAQASGIRISFETDELPARMPPELTIACFRIVQEALTNIIRHAHARHAWIELRRRSRTLVLTMRDDGTGFDSSSKRRSRLGLLGMQERASLVGGKLEINSKVGKGTRIEAILPVRKAPKRNRAIEGVIP